MKGVIIMDDILAKFKLDKHHKMERFGVLFLILCICLVSVTGTILLKTNKEDAQTLSSRVVYTQSFTTSKTGNKGSVYNIYTNETNTKLFILLRFDDMSVMPADANDYQLFLTGSDINMDKQDLTISPSGAIYMFGETGYMGIYLSESRGFDKQILYMVVRSNKELTQSQQTTTYSDSSYEDYDQFALYFNAGGDDSVKAEFLETDGEISIPMIYEELITRPSEMSIRAQLQQDLESMASEMTRINEYTERLSACGIRISDSDFPSSILEDEIMDVSGNTIAAVDYQKSLASRDTTLQDNTLYLKTDYSPYGFDLDWQTTSVKDGYLDGLKGSLTDSQYLSKISQNFEEVVHSEEYKNAMGIQSTFYLTDGTQFNSNISMIDSERIAIDSAINNWKSSIASYLSVKNIYQYEHMVQLLELEASVNVSGHNFSVNDSDTVLTKW